MGLRKNMPQNRLVNSPVGLIHPVHRLPLVLPCLPHDLHGEACYFVVCIHAHSIFGIDTSHVDSSHSSRASEVGVNFSVIGYVGVGGVILCLESFEPR